MTCYPVYIPTLNRYEHFKACVESLARCTHADKTELVVSLDFPPSEKYVEGWRKIKEYLTTLQTLGFGKVTVFEQTKNLGVNRNNQVVKDYCIAHYGAYIGSEDDNVFAPGFLDFINQAAERYWDDPRVLTVCGYTQPFVESNFVRNGGAPGGRPLPCGCGAAYLSPDHCGWGTLLWHHKDPPIEAGYADPNWPRCLLRKPWFVLKFLFMYPIGFVMFWGMVRQGLKYGDLCRTAYNFAHGTYQLRPTKSLVRNCGQDGSGLHCGVNEAAARQEISDAKTFDFGAEPPRVSHKGLFWQGWEGTRFAKFMPWLKR